MASSSPQPYLCPHHQINICSMIQNLLIIRNMLKANHMINIQPTKFHHFPFFPSFSEFHDFHDFHNHAVLDLS